MTLRHVDSVKQSHESFDCVDRQVGVGQVYLVDTGDSWSVNALNVDGQLRIEGVVHAFGHVTGAGTITGEGELRLH